MLGWSLLPVALSPLIALSPTPIPFSVERFDGYTSMSEDRLSRLV